MELNNFEFRAYDKLNNRMHYFTQNDAIRFSDFSDPANNWSDPMQYIGQEDMCKKKIFDGDIVKHGNVIGIVKWDNSPYGGAKFFVDGITNYGENYFDVCWKECWNALKVIGNIHKNKKIIKELEQA